MGVGANEGENAANVFRASVAPPRFSFAAQSRTNVDCRPFRSASPPSPLYRLISCRFVQTLSQRW